MYKITKTAIAVVFLALSACQQNQTSQPGVALSELPQAEVKKSESDKVNAFFEKAFMDNVMRSPVYQSYLGIKQDYDKWDDISQAHVIENHKIDKKNRETLLNFDYEALDEATKVSYDLMKQNLDDRIADFKWRFHNYPVNQMYGTHTMVPALLINQHQIADIADAEAYISRLKGVPQLFLQLEINLEKRAEKGIIIPKFVFPHAIESSKNIIKGHPFEKGEDSTLFADFKRKVNQLEISSGEKRALIAKATVSLETAVKPAYIRLIGYLERLARRADDRDGVWKFPEGKAFYNNALARTTTTNLTAGEIHQIGLDEVARIHNEMRTIKKKVRFKGDLMAFMNDMKTNKRFYLPATEKGKAAYLANATDVIDNMKSRLDELFLTKPQADLVVKRVEAFREKAAGKAFYERPAADGTRPGYYYANLYDMRAMPTYQLEALAYHEGIPGHHMQIAIAQELQGIPKFRKFGRFTAYVEGWGLYSEYLPKEIGLYQDPYSDFGRLAMELWRACRLVVDTGIHSMKWTRQQGIDYYAENTPNAKADIVKMVERHIVMPSQATAYKIGMLKILALRTSAKKRLGEKFDVRKFHDVVLKNGPVPLNVLELFVNDWVNNQSS